MIILYTQSTDIKRYRLSKIIIYLGYRRESGEVANLQMVTVVKILRRKSAVRIIAPGWHIGSALS